MSVQRQTVLRAIGASKQAHGEKRRIELLGKMSDRYMRYLTEGNRSELLKLADEYQCLGRYGMPLTAARIRYEANNL